MNLNKIQVAILNKLSKEADLDVDSYVKKHSLEFICVQKNYLDDLNEEEGDEWINKSYILSLKDVDLGE
ncbi:hypothetical protein [Maridesulfovibrio sp.]|uniref:hypothetical protein n=1 Tax=Maridesulfovibrio sp. TaxID=2795000 RepID=UPI0029CA5B4B|nr:hypothetical protein [Maridesulfovibrio sp.]